MQRVTQQTGGAGGGYRLKGGEGEDAGGGWGWWGGPCSLCGSHRTISNYRTKATHSALQLQHCSFACLMSALLNAKRPWRPQLHHPPPPGAPLQWDIQAWRMRVTVFRTLLWTSGLKESCHLKTAAVSLFIGKRDSFVSVSSENRGSSISTLLSLYLVLFRISGTDPGSGSRQTSETCLFTFRLNPRLSWTLTKLHLLSKLCENTHIHPLPATSHHWLLLLRNVTHVNVNQVLQVQTLWREEMWTIPDFWCLK